MAESFAEMMARAKAAGAGKTEPAEVLVGNGESVVVNKQQVIDTPAPVVKMQQDDGELQRLRKEIEDSRKDFDARLAAREAELRAETEAAAAAAREAARKELNVDDLHSQLAKYRDAERNGELESMINSLEGNDSVDTDQVRNIAKTIMPLLKKLEDRTASKNDINKIAALERQIQDMRSGQVEAAKMSVQDRVTLRAKDMGVQVDNLLEDDRYKRLLKERVSGARQTHGQALLDMLNAGDVEEAAAKLHELQGLIKPDYAKAAVANNNGVHGGYVGASGEQAKDTPTDFNAVADDLFRKLRGKEISRTEHGKQVQEAFKNLFTVGGR